MATTSPVQMVTGYTPEQYSQMTNNLAFKNQARVKENKKPTSKLAPNLLIGAGTGSAIGFGTGYGLTTLARKSCERVLNSGESVEYIQELRQLFKDSALDLIIKGHNVDKDAFIDGLNGNLDSAEACVGAFVTSLKNHKFILAGALAIGTAVIGAGIGLIRHHIQKSKADK